MEQQTSRRVALVTGASRGIGRAIAERLSRDGLFVGINYRENEAAAQEVLAAIGGEAHGALCRFDVADAAQVEAGVKAFVDRVARSAAVGDVAGRLDVLVNNAGIAVDGLLMRVKADEWHRVIDTNLSSAFYLCKAASRHLLKVKESGRIINLTSVVGELGSAGQVSYVSAKAGLIGLTKTLAREYAGRGLTVNAVSPGFIDTDMTRAHVTAEAQKALLAQIPLGRIGRPEDVAAAVGYLASLEAGYITGQVVRVNGGLMMG